MVKVNKKYERDFTLVQNTIFKINDLLPEGEKISFKAMGIFFYLWHLPHDWEFHESEIINHASEKITAFRSGRAELEKYGFIEKKRNRNDKGQVGEYEWVLNDEPALDYLKQDNPTLDYPKQGNPILDNQTLQSTKGTKNLSNKVSSSSGGDSKNQSEEQNSKENTPSNTFKMYEQLWGFPNAIAMQDLKEWINDYSDELVACAITIAGRNNVSSRGAYSYLNKILTEWAKSGVKSVEDAKKQNEEHSQRLDREFKQRKSYGGHTPIKEEPPEWLKKYEDNNYKPDHSKSNNNQHDSKRTKELEDKLKRIRNGDFTNEN
ncbi:DnaD domain-containing protein [Apilactobacillus timberlakei]|uniref:DnaD domain-containing protein n=1 Tax=Apilactobacillus timberlakei TaxID=2008380 RepID=UPI001129F269|nr:DnaD domain protein [Apilactobacillus timberlakei]TPR12265.1 DnaD domain protein [Apilactobacillus timberlakei]